MIRTLVCSCVTFWRV